MIQEFDFHMHTNNSDGEYSVGQIVAMLKKQGIRYFSVTDHDNTDSIEQVGKEDLTGLSYISGVEISSVLDGKYRLHILGYGIDGDRSRIDACCSQLKRARQNKIYAIAEQLDRNCHIQIEQQELDDIIAGTNVPGKPHIAHLLVQKGYASDIKDAFARYLDSIKSGKYRIDAKIAIDAIKDAGGKVIWAHPKQVEEDHGIDFTEILDRLIELGIDGIEVYNSLHTYGDCQRYLAESEARGLLTSGGSDFHGEHTKFGVFLGGVFKDHGEIRVDPDTLTLYKALKA